MNIEYKASLPLLKKHPPSKRNTGLHQVLPVTPGAHLRVGSAISRSIQSLRLLTLHDVGIFLFPLKLD